MRLRTALLTAAIACTLATVPAVQSAGAPDRPAGVKPYAWIRLGNGLGFVVQHERTQLPGSTGLPALEGYFVLKRQGGWWRLDARAGSALLPTSDSR